MSRAFDIVQLVITIIALMFLSLIAWSGYEEVAWQDRCKDAGGIPAKHMVCVNPAAVIEVD
jgi:hypothetical protein